MQQRNQRKTALALTLAGLSLALLGGCGSQFAAPGRGDLAFAASRVQAEQIELTGSGLVEGGWQADLRLGLTDRDALEVSAFGRGGAGEKHGFVLGGLAFRRWVLRGDDPVHLSFGAGLGGGVGGWNNHMDEALANYTPAGAAWLDVGLAVPLRSWLTAYGMGRVQGAAAFSAEPDKAPPTTLWLQTGVGLRADLGPAFVTLDYHLTRYDNALDADWFAGPGFAIGWRM